MKARSLAAVLLVMGTIQIFAQEQSAKTDDLAAVSTAALLDQKSFLEGEIAKKPEIRVRVQCGENFSDEMKEQVLTRLRQMSQVVIVDEKPEYEVSLSATQADQTIVCAMTVTRHMYSVKGPQSAWHEVIEPQNPEPTMFKDGSVAGALNKALAAFDVDWLEGCRKEDQKMRDNLRAGLDETKAELQKRNAAQ